MKRRRSLLETSRDLEDQQIKREQRTAREAIDWPLHKAAELQQIQDSLDAIARIEFKERFKTKPKQVGTSGTDKGLHEFSVPVFAIEYANLRFVLGDNTVPWMKMEKSKMIRMARERSIGEVATGSIRKLFDHDFALYDKNRLGAHLCSFEAVGLCSGCQKWGRLGRVSTQSDKLHVSYPKISKYEDLARPDSLELFNEAGSGLALDCGTLPIFGFEPEESPAIIECKHMEAKIDAWGKRLKDN